VLMIAAKADVNAVDETGATALHYASDLWNVELVKCLLEHGECCVALPVPLILMSECSMQVPIQC
jgi:ankyrin repeat protein